MVILILVIGIMRQGTNKRIIIYSLQNIIKVRRLIHAVPMKVSFSHNEYQYLTGNHKVPSICLVGFSLLFTQTWLAEQ